MLITLNHVLAMARKQNRRYKLLVAPAHYMVSDSEGSESYTSYKIVSELAKRGHELVIITALWRVKDWPYPNARVISMVPNGRHGGTLRESWRHWRFPQFVRRTGLKLLAKEDFDLIYHLRPSSVNTANPLFWADHQHPHLMGPMLPPQKYTSPHDMTTWLGTKPGPAEPLINLAYRLTKGRLHRNFKRTIQDVDWMICVSKEAKQVYQQYIPPERIRIIPFGVEVTGRVATPRPAAKPVRILALAKIVERKGLDVLLEAMQLLQAEQCPVTLDIVGYGPALPSLKKQAVRLKLGKAVRFRGRLQHSEIWPAYQAADIFCSPSRYESFGHTFLEAMSAGLPVVGTTTGGSSEIITPREGLLVPPEDVPALAAALRTLVNNPTRRIRMAKAARQRVLRHFAWDRISEQYEQTMYDVVHGKKPTKQRQAIK